MTCNWLGWLLWCSAFVPLRNADLDLLFRLGSLLVLLLKGCATIAGKISRSAVRTLTEVALASAADTDLRLIGPSDWARRLSAPLLEEPRPPDDDVVFVLAVLNRLRPRPCKSKCAAVTMLLFNLHHGE